MESIPEDVASRLIGHIRNRTTDLAEGDLRVPISHFVSAEHAAAERDLFRTMFVVAALGTEIADAGDFVTRKINGIPLLIVRQADGGVKSFVNICRHRGGRVEWEASGNRRGFMCRYHGWAYDSAGALRNIPYEATYEHVDKSCHALAEVLTGQRHGLIWVNLDNGQTQTVADYLGSTVDERLRQLTLDGMVIVREETFQLAMNWKLVVDGALDIMHAPFLHLGGVDEFVATNYAVWDSFGRHGQLFTPRKKSVDRIKSGEDISRGYRYFSTAMMVFPNNVVIAAPDHIEFWSVWPGDSPNGASVHIRCLAQPAALTELVKERIGRSWQVLHFAATEEDWPMAATIQDNAEINPDGSYLYGRGEVCTQHLHRELARALAYRQVAIAGICQPADAAA